MFLIVQGGDWETEAECLAQGHMVETRQELELLVHVYQAIPSIFLLGKAGMCR